MRKAAPGMRIASTRRGGRVVTHTAWAGLGAGPAAGTGSKGNAWWGAGDGRFQNPLWYLRLTWCASSSRVLRTGMEQLRLLGLAKYVGLKEMQLTYNTS